MLKVQGYAVGAIGTNCYFLIDEDTKDTFITDPGGNGRELILKVKELGLNVKGILLTHGHWDHILAVDELRMAFGVPVYAWEMEREILEDARKNLSQQAIRDAGVTVQNVTYLKDGDILKVGTTEFKLIATPGHTRGGCCYYCEAAGVLISGDTLFQGSVGRTDLYSGEFRTLIRSVREKLMELPDDVIVYPGHESATSIGYERDYNPYIG